MSELGSNQGQDENKNTPVFDSANLAEKQQAEHFTNVEGNEARAKAAERQAEAVKKKAEAAHANEIKKAAKKEAGGYKGGILNFLFGGWHKWVFIALIIIVAFCIVFFVTKKNTGNEVVDKNSIEKYGDELTEKVRQSKWDREVYLSAVNEFRAKRDSAKDQEEAFYYGFYYARFIYDTSISTNDGKIAFSEIPEKDDISNEDACDLKYLYLKVYGVETIEDNAPLKSLMEQCND